MHELMRVDYYWSGMEEECHAFAQACFKCGGVRSQPTFDVPMGKAPTPSRPFEVIHVDHKSGLPLSGGYAHVLVVVCALTRFTLFIPVQPGTSSRILAVQIKSQRLHVAYRGTGGQLVLEAELGGR